MDKGNILLIIIFLFLAGATWWLNNRHVESSDSQQVAAQHVPDFYMENIVSTEMDGNGRPARQLFAQKIVHFSDDNSSDYLKPRLSVLEQDKPPWQIRAASAHQSADGKTLLLQGKVNIDRSSGHGIKPMHLITRDLKINTETEFSETDQPVLMLSLKDKTEGVGMEAWMKAPMRIKLLSKARGHYEIEH